MLFSSFGLSYVRTLTVILVWDFYKYRGTSEDVYPQVQQTACLHEAVVRNQWRELCVDLRAL